MKKRLLASVASMALSLPMIIATNMYIKQSDGKLLSFNVDKIEEVYFDDSNLADASDLPLKFEILSDSTVEVKQDSSYKDLSSVTIPEKVRINGKVYDVTGIGEQAFHACYMLNSLEIPASIKRIGNWSFAYCEYTKEIKIPSGLESIGSYAFYGCYALTEMSLPSSVTSIEDYAFQNCKNLDLVIDNSEENITLGDGVFDNCKSVKFLKGDSGKIVDISKTPLKFEILSDSTVEVKQDSSYKDLSSVTIPEKVRIDGKVYDVTGIGEQAFHACYMLKSLEIPASIKRIGNWSFAYCEYTKEIKIPSGLESIGSYAFYGCYALTEMSLPSSVTSIEDYAFQNCKNLDLVIDNSEENITLGDGVFDNCKSVKFLKGDSGKIVDISKTPLKFEILSDSTVEVKKDSSYKDLSSVTIPEKVRIDGKVYDVTGIGEQAFHACYMLNSLEIPASIKRIGNWSFAYCEYTKEIKIPSDLESIGSYAFYGCYALTEMSLPSSVTSIEDYAFQNCKNLDLVIDNSEENITLGDGVFDNCKSVKYLK